MTLTARMSLQTTLVVDKDIMYMAFRNAVQLHVAHQLENVYEYNEKPRFHPRDDPFQSLTEQQFIKLFRLNTERTVSIITVVEQHLGQGLRSSALDATVQVLAALRFYATGSYQNCIGQNVNIAISQPSVNRCVRIVTNILNQPEVFNNWVHFPGNMKELHQLRSQYERILSSFSYNLCLTNGIMLTFWRDHQFPGAIGCIDYTHVAIFPPPKEDENYPEHVYVNRKGYHSINVQLICDADMRIMNINARYPGSTHNSYIWNNSNVFLLMRDLHNRIAQYQGQRFFLLGDSGYALRPWMMTPFLDAAEENIPIRTYNARHKSTRSLIERCNGLLKMSSVVF